MERSFSINVCGRPIGKVTVQKQGLYYRFICRCDLSGDIIYRLMVSCGTVRENLGVLIPQKGSFYLDTKLPVKRIGEGDMVFTLLPKQDACSGTFIPIYPEEPFSYISRLKKTFLMYENGQPGIHIEKMQE